MAFATGSTYKIENINDFVIKDLNSFYELSLYGDSLKDGFSIIEAVGKSVPTASGSTRNTSEKASITFEIFYQDLVDDDLAFLQSQRGLLVDFLFTTTNGMNIQFQGIMNLNENIKTNEVLTLPITVELESGDIDSLLNITVA